MKRQEKLASLGQIATILRETALQRLVQANLKEAAIREDLSALSEARSKAIADAASDPTAGLQLERYRPWADARRAAGLAALAHAVEVTEQCRAAAQSAVGRMDVMGKLAEKLAATARVERARRG